MKLVKVIKSREGVLHFRRWEILRTRWGSLYLHQILQPDQDLHRHDHPWDFWGIILWGGYDELVGTRWGESEVRKRGFLSWAKMPANGLYHKILRLHRPTWSLVWVGPRKHHWGYATPEGWVPHDLYRDLKRGGYWDHER